MTSKQFLLLYIAVLVLVVVAGRGATRPLQAMAPGAGDRQAGPTPGAQPPGFLTGPREGDPLQIALDYLHENAASLGLSAGDLADIVVTDRYVTQHNGVTHLYLRQRLNGVEVLNGDLAIHISRKGEVISLGNRFIGNLAQAANTQTPALAATDAIIAVAQKRALTLTEAPQVVESRAGEVVISAGALSQAPIPVRLVYVRLADGTARLAWNARIEEPGGQHVWDLAVDAASGEILRQVDYVVHDRWGGEQAGAQDARPAAAAETTAPHEPRTGPQGQPPSPLVPPSYRVFPLPLEHPNDGVGLPDSQMLVTGVADVLASPFGWHDIDGAPGHEFPDTIGNNVTSQEDRNGDDLDGFRPTGRHPAEFDFDYPFDPSVGPTEGENTSTSIVNLFYWNNIMHDVAYQYGFDEASGNFQYNNYGRGGLNFDAVQADAQDGFDLGLVNNAYFLVTPDGQAPRMGMFVFNLTTPFRESALDNGIIIHEYGHGISTRLVGGPSTAGCLFNGESMGEGWSDWFTLALTAKEGDAGARGRGMGTYVLGQPPDGPGIRRVRYSTDMNIDPQTYDWIKRSGETHDVGEVWATMLWDVYWALVGQYGFDPNVYTGGGGNNLALRLVIDGMKFTVCDPGFVDARNAILTADMVDTGGANQCTLWQAFARRGLGFGASQGSPFSPFDGSEAFDIPPVCRDDLSLVKTTAPEVAEAGQLLTYILSATNYTSNTLTGLVLSDPIPAHTTYVPGSASDGGSEAGGVVTWQIPRLGVDEAITRTFQVTVARDFPDPATIFFDDMESGGANWTASGLWHLQDDSEPCGNSFSPTHSWYYGQTPACSYVDDSSGQLTTANPIALPFGVATLKFRSWEEFEACCDRGSLQVSSDGVNFQTLWLTTNNRASWYQASVDLSAYAGQNIWLRFEFTSDFSIVFRGWYVDDVEIVVAPSVDNTAALSASEGPTAIAESHTLVIKAPDIGVEPPALEETLPLGSIATQILTITNSGTAPLDFTLSARTVETPTLLAPLALARPEASRLPAYQPAQQQAPSYAGAPGGFPLVAQPARSYQPKAGALTSAAAARVLLLAAADVFQIQAILQAFPDLAVVDVFDARMATPALDQLLAYDTAVVIANQPFASPAGVGDVLADYVDNGGTVVQTVPTFFDPAGIGWGLAGRWVSDGYSPLIGTGDWFLTASLGDFDASHPIMQGVDAASDFFRQVMQLAPGASLVASWTDDEFVATKGAVVALNTFLADGFAWTGDVDLIVHNSIIWLQLQQGEAPAWLSMAPVSGTVPIDGAQTVEVTFDAGAPGVGPGDHNALIRVLSNDPDEHVVDVPVALHVIAPSLSITGGGPGGAPAWFGRPAEATVNFASNSFEVAATTFSVDFDEACLRFDPTDGDGDGVPDAITFTTPAGLQASVMVDLNDSDGELDFFIADVSPPLAPFADGPLATIRFTVACLPSGGAAQAIVGFSTAPAATFSNLNGVSIPAQTLPGAIEIRPEAPGDCNQDGELSAGDTISCVLEIFDGDGSFWLDAPGGGFAGSPQGCDSNQDTTIDAGDIICTVLLIFQGQGACAAPLAQAAAAGAPAAALSIAQGVAAQPGQQAAVPVHLAGNGAAIAAAVFAVTFDEQYLHFDPTDANGDGVPDAVVFHTPPGFVTNAALAGNGRLQVSILDLAPPLATLPDGPLVTVHFTVDAGAPAETIAAVAFASDLQPSLGTVNGQSAAVSAANGSVLVAPDEPGQPEQPKDPGQPSLRIYLPAVRR